MTERRIVYKRGTSSSSTDRFHVMPITMPKFPWDGGDETIDEGSNCVVILRKEVIKKNKREREAASVKDLE